MFGRMMNNYYYGKSGKGDFRKDDLPETRPGSPCQPEPVFTSIYDKGKEPGYVANYDSFF